VFDIFYSFTIILCGVIVLFVYKVMLAIKTDENGEWNDLGEKIF